MNLDWFFQVSAEIDIVCNEQGLIQYTNSAWNNLIGFARDETMNKPLVNFLIPFYHHMFHAWIEKVKNDDFNEFICEVTDGQGFSRMLTWTHAEIVDDQSIYLKGTLHPKAAPAQEIIKYHSLVLQMFADPAILIDLNERVLDVNAAFSDMYGWNKDEIMGRKIPNIPDHLADSYKRNIHLVISGGTISNVETQRIKKDGHLVDVSITVSSVKNEMGVPIGLIAVTRDISKRKKLEQELERKSKQLQLANKRFTGILESITDGFFVLDGEYRFTYLNPPLLSYLKTPVETLIGKVVWEALPTLRNSLFEENFKKTMEDKISRNFQCLSEASRKYVDIRTYPTGEGIAVFLKDFTALQITLQKLRESEEALREITENATEDFCIHSPDYSKIYFLSPTSGDTWGMGPERILQNPVEALQYIHPDDQQKVKAAVRVRPETILKVEYRLIHPTKGLRWIRWRRYPVATKEREIQRNISISEDITYVKEKEQQILKAEKLEIVSQLAAGVAHEIRNPLTVIKGFMQMNQMNTDLLHADIMMDELNNIENVLQEFLMLAKPHHEMKFSKRNLSIVLKETIRWLRKEPFFQRVEYHCDWPNELPNLQFDEKHIKQLLLNLVKNAIEAMPNGGKVWISAKALPTEVVIEVRDEGHGIPSERLLKLGEPFYSNKEKGIGLGLMVCTKIMQNHNGTINIASVQGEGTTISLGFPMQTVEEEPRNFTMLINEKSDPHPI